MEVSSSTTFPLFQFLVCCGPQGARPKGGCFGDGLTRASRSSRARRRRHDQQNEKETQKSDSLQSIFFDHGPAENILKANFTEFGDFGKGKNLS